MKRSATPRMRVILEDDKYHLNVHPRGYQIIDRTKLDFDVAVINDRNVAFNMCDMMNRQWREGLEAA